MLLALSLNQLGQFPVSLFAYAYDISGSYIEKLITPMKMGY